MKLSQLSLLFPLLGFVCFLLAGLFVFVWPKSKAKVLDKLNFPKFVLHYFHPLAWVLAGMAIFWYRPYPELGTITGGLAVLALGIFLFIFVRS